MRFWPDLVSNLLPGFALLTTCTSLVFLIAMKKASGGFIAAFYTLRIFTDSAQLLLLALLCVDQFISVVWTKRHKEFSEYYFNKAFIFFVLILSIFSFIPAWIEPILSSENSTIKVSSFCAMQDVLGQNFYNIQLEIRKWFPFVCIAILCLTALILFSLQLIQKGHFKWSDNNKQSTKLFLLLLCRAILFIVCVHIPLLELPLVMKTAFPDRRSSNKLDVSKIPNEQRFLQEILIRIWQSLLIGLFEPLLDAFFLPQFPAEICAFFNLHEMKRTWQSADDPPLPCRSVGASGFDIFGSFHSITGNIIGEAGIPMELNADIQRSVSFYYDE